jgi:hypothetical protein
MRQRVEGLKTPICLTIRHTYTMGYMPVEARAGATGCADELRLHTEYLRQALLGQLRALRQRPIDRRLTVLLEITVGRGKVTATDKPAMSRQR